MIRVQLQAVVQEFNEQKVTDVLDNIQAGLDVS